MPESLIIRPVQPDEAGALARLFHDVWHETQAQLQDPRQARARPLAFFAARIESRLGTTLVATSNGHLTGFVTWTGNMLNSLFVKPEFAATALAKRFATAPKKRWPKQVPNSLSCVAFAETLPAAASVKAGDGAPAILKPWKIKHLKARAKRKPDA